MVSCFNLYIEGEFVANLVINIVCFKANFCSSLWIQGSYVDYELFFAVGFFGSNHFLYFYPCSTLMSFLIVIYVICQVNGCLSYYDRVPDGFYLIQGMDPFVWTLCTDVQEESRIPSLESLKTVSPSELSIEVALIDRNSDSDLRQLENMVAGLSCNFTTTNDMVEQLAKLVCSRMG